MVYNAILGELFYEHIFSFDIRYKIPYKSKPLYIIFQKKLDKIKMMMEIKIYHKFLLMKTI